MLSGCVNPSATRALTAIGMPMEDVEKSRFLMAAQGVNEECVNRKILKMKDYQKQISVRLQQFEEQYPLFVSMNKPLFMPGVTQRYCDYWTGNIEHWLNTGEYVYKGQGQWVVYKDDRLPM